MANHTPTIEYTTPKNMVVRTVHFSNTRACLELCSAMIRVHVSYPVRAAGSPSLVQIIILPCVYVIRWKTHTLTVKESGEQSTKESQPLFLDRPP